MDEYLRTFLTDDINVILSDEYLCECIFELKLRQIENCTVNYIIKKFVKNGLSGNE
jgi:hypothetical protein